jgi:uncharacterized protein (DUF1800 family)
MRRRSLLAFSIVLAFSAAAQKNSGDFSAPLSSSQKIIHALNRLTFGPRPGDFERVEKMGIEPWIAQQLHPDDLAENPVLAQKLAPLDTLRMTSREMAAKYPPPQLIKAMMDGRVAYPSDPEQRMIVASAERRYKRKQDAKDDAGVAGAIESLNLTGEQKRTLRKGTAEEKLELFRMLPEEKQDALLEALPPKIRIELYAAAPPELRRKIQKSGGPMQVIVQDLPEAKLYRAIYSNHQLEEVLTDFWFNHFNIFLDKGADRYLVTAYERDVIRPYVLLKFGSLLRATAESPAMLFYLDNFQSVDPAAADRMPAARLAKARRGLNENYARELMELHTLGVDGGCTQRDVTEVARCFTGWTLRNPRQGGGFEFIERLHDRGAKIVLGVKIPAGGGMDDGLKVLEILAHHPSTARFISRKLAVRFVADHPPDSLVEKMAQTFRRSDGDIRAVLETMLHSSEFWSQEAYRSKVKSPLEMVASSVRALNADVEFGFALAQQLTKLGQPLYRKQEPTGYSNSSEEWLNSAALVGRMNFAMALAANRIPGVKVDAARFGAEQDTPSIARALLLADLPKESRGVIERALTEQRDAGNAP